MQGGNIASLGALSVAFRVAAAVAVAVAVAVVGSASAAGSAPDLAAPELRPDGQMEREARDEREAFEALERLRLPWPWPVVDGPEPDEGGPAVGAPDRATSSEKPAEKPGDGVQGVAAAPDNAPSPSSPVACPPGRMRSRFLALPVYGTLPNEGSTFGAIPILLRVCSGDGRTHSIYAPSLSYNAVLGVTGTMRWFGFLPGNQSITTTASWSQHTNRGAFFLWEVRPAEQGKMTLEALAQAQQSIFFRLFGLGPESQLGDETNQARRRALVSIRGGLNLPRRLDVGVILQARVDDALDAHIASLVPSRERFPDVAGVRGSSAGLAALIDVRYDSRKERDYAAKGVMAGLQVGPLVGLTGVPTHLRAQGEVRALWSHTAWFTGAARARVHYVDHPEVPFYYLSNLGGGMLLRGFIEDRFLDRGAWLVEIEQRFRILRTHLLGVTVDWRIDPFLAMGQVFHGGDDLFARPRLAGGIGLRAWLQPNVVGRIDVAYGGEGIAPYVELGYPF